MSDTPEVRCVWLSHSDVSWLHTSADTPQRSDALARLNAAFNAAHADPVELAIPIAVCPEHGVHGERETCFECGGEVDQVLMVPLAALDGLPLETT